MSSLLRSKSTLWVLPIGALLVLVWVGGEAGEPGVCLDNAARVTTGQPLQLTVEAPTWFRLGTQDAHAYRADVSGPEGSTLELWTTYWESGGCYHYSDELVEQRVSTGAPEAFEWGASWEPRALWVAPPGGGGATSFSVTLTELAAPPVPIPLVVPASAHRAGVGGSFFRTDLWLLNRELRSTEAELTFVPEVGGGEQSVAITLGPQQLLAMDDLVLETFGLDDARGAVLVSPDGPLVVLSRTFTAAPEGTYGQTVPAEQWYRAAGADSPDGAARTLLHVAGNADYRSNVGFVEVLGLDGEVDLELLDGEGTTVATGTVTVPARSFLQVDDVFSRLGAPPLAHASVRVTVRGLGRVFTYASVVDNRTSDPIFFPGLPDTEACTTLLVPAAAATAGAHGTDWRTDLWVQGKEPATALQLTFLPSDGSAETVGTFSLSTAGVLALEDVVSLLGAHGSGALLLEADGNILATSRTSNVTSAGTYGQLIPAECWPYHQVLWRATIIGVESSGERRTNLGMVNPDRVATFEVVLRLLSDDGVLLGSRVYPLEPRRHLQVNDLFAALHVAGQTNCRVSLEVEGEPSWLGIRAYASVVDNRSGDPMFVPAAPSYLDIPLEVELDNRRSAVLVDQLPQAVSLDPLPAGTLTATVSGGGDLGRPDLPIRVLCLYNDPAGRLRSAALAVGEGVADVAGGGRLWCVIPDWLSTADNTGEVTVTLTGGDRDASLTLDGRDNAVAFDSLEGPVVWARPTLEMFSVLTTGDLGRPDLAPQVLAMYREQGSRRLRVRTLVDGDTFGPVATDFQVLVAVLDWVNRDDNTGTTRLEGACTTRPGGCNLMVAGSISSVDCEVYPAGWLGERITLEGRAGQVVSLTGIAGDPSFYLAVVDPSGMRIAASPAAGPDGRTEIADLTLPADGTYEVWAAAHVGAWTTADYTVEIRCQGR